VNSTAGGNKGSYKTSRDSITPGPREGRKRRGAFAFCFFQRKGKGERERSAGEGFARDRGR